VLRSYPKVLALGHRRISGILEGDIVVQEKIDGSQFSFGIVDGELWCKSRKRHFQPGGEDKTFEVAVARVLAVKDKLVPGWIYRGEYLSRPKHNCLAYDRAPRNNIVIFDIETGPGYFASYAELTAVSCMLDFEPVRYLWSGPGGAFSQENIDELLKETSQLGGQKIEGVVVKNYDQMTPDGNVMIGKYVSEAFKEVHRKDWKESNPSKKDLYGTLIEMHRSEARWNKAIQHLTEDGLIEGEPKDIGPLIKEIQRDTLEECEESIKHILFKHAWPQIQRGIINGFPEWYKKKLLEKQFEE
jgi:hypothetical protein